MFSYNLACANSYSPPGPEMAPAYSARTVVTYQTHIETGNGEHGKLGTLDTVPLDL